MQLYIDIRGNKRNIKKIYFNFGSLIGIMDVEVYFYYLKGPFF